MTWPEIESRIHRALGDLLSGDAESRDILNSLLEGRLRALEAGPDATLIIGAIPEIEDAERIYAAAADNGRGVARKIAAMFDSTPTRMVDFFTVHRAMERLVRRAVRDFDVEVEAQQVWHVVVRRK